MNNMPEVEDIHGLAERYEVTPEKLRELLAEAEKQNRVRSRREFQGVEIWGLSETDGWFIRWLRDQYAISQEELASELGVTQTTVSKWETRGAAPAWRVPELRPIVRRIAERKSAADAA